MLLSQPLSAHHTSNQVLCQLLSLLIFLFLPRIIYSRVDFFSGQKVLHWICIVAIRNMHWRIEWCGILKWHIPALHFLPFPFAISIPEALINHSMSLLYSFAKTAHIASASGIDVEKKFVYSFVKHISLLSFLIPYCGGNAFMEAVELRSIGCVFFTFTWYSV